MLVADIFITTKNRPELLRKSLESFRSTTPRELYRLTVIRDGDYPETEAVLSDFKDVIDYVLVNRENAGLGPSINLALAHIKALNDWYDDPTVPDKSKVSPFICYNQDDLLYSPGWLEKLSRFFIFTEFPYKIGFASGVECIEHKTKKELGNGLVLKDWIRAAQMFGRREYWLSMHPIPRYDPETGRTRAKPNDGMGSGVDWWFVRNADNSVCKTGRTCLVIPGLVKHLGYKDSTWLKRELPESSKDKADIARAMGEIVCKCGYVPCQPQAHAGWHPDL